MPSKCGFQVFLLDKNFISRRHASMARRKTSPRPKPVNLALQGGGAHGAFTWGVLERLLLCDEIVIDAISGTSAGAVNAVVMADGYLKGGPAAAIQQLRDFWHQVSTVACLSPLQPSFMEKWLGQMDMARLPGFMAMDFFTRMFSPYQYNPFDINPLREILNDMIDFEALRTSKTLKLFLNATHVKSGKIRVFNNSELSAESVMASACLPFLFQTAYVDGEPYWDGGYSGNPALFPLFYNSSSEDIILVQINPITVDAVPTQAAEIFDRVNEISFNSTLIREMRAIAFVKKLLKEHRISGEYYSDVRMHLIEAEAVMRDIGAVSKFNADWDFLSYLHGIGMQTAQDWLDANLEHIGKRPSIDIEALYL